MERGTPDPAVTVRLRLRHPLDLGLTLGPLQHARADPTLRILGRRVAWRAWRTAAGPAAVCLRLSGDELEARAWGPGTDAALRAVPALIGEDDDPSALRPAHPVVRELARRLPGLRLGRTGAVLESLVPAIIEQKVTGTEASRSFRQLVTRYGEEVRLPAGAPPLRVQPAARVLAALPSWELHPIGLERRRAELVRHAAGRADRLEQIVDLPREAAYARLRAIPGIGPWTAAEVGARALGDPDVVSVGDFHLPHLVSWVLAGEPRGTDERMLELLEPYAGQRARVVRLLEASGLRPPAYGPRMAPRSIASL